jgi:hypothetical protein
MNNPSKKSATFPFVDAKYRAEPNPTYAGNPFIEALPPLPDDIQLQRALAAMPKFDPALRQLSNSERIQRLDMLSSLVIPLPRLVKLARAMIKMMLTGYGKRKPFSEEDGENLKALYLAQQTGEFISVKSDRKASQHSMSLIGASGSGKSYGMHTVASMFPPVIFHPELGKWQIPFMFIEMSYDGESVHTLASALFTELDGLLKDSNYTDTYMNRRGNAEQRLAKALDLCYQHGVGLIIVDEAQNERSIGNEQLSAAQAKRRKVDEVSKRESPLTKLLITASNLSHVPLLFSGTLELKTKAGTRFSRSRRFAGRGSDVWLPFEAPDRTADGQFPKELSEFDVMMTILFRYQLIRNPIPYDVAWADLFFDRTQGIPDIMVKLFEACQETAIANGSETITVELVDEVLDTQFVTTEHGIKALRTRDKHLASTVTDLVSMETEPKDDAPFMVQIPAPYLPPVDKKRTPKVVDAVAMAAAAAAEAKKYPSPQPIILTAEVLAQAKVMDVPTGSSAKNWQNSLRP